MAIGMTGRPSSPLAAAVGLVAVTALAARKLPGLLPAVVREVAGAGAAARRRYDALALHGKDVLGHGSAPALATEVRPVRTGPSRAAVADGDIDSPHVAPAEAVEPVTAAPVPAPPLGRTESVPLSEDVLDEVAQLTPGAELKHADLPLADFDHQTVPQLRGRLRTLELPQLVQLRDYEQAHAARLPVLTLLDNRIASLSGE